MRTASPGLPHLLELIRSPRGGLAILAALLLSTALVIQAGAATLQVSTTTLPDGAQTMAYSQTLTATGGTAPYTWDITEGALPTGLTLAGATISGSPSVLANSAFTVRVTDGDGNTATKSLAIKVNPQLTVATTALASGVVSVPYVSQTLAATGGSAPYTWAVTTGALPAGLTLNASTGAISGTPTATAPAFTVTVTDAAAHTATKSLTINVSGAGVLTIVTSALPNGVQNLAGYSATLAAAGGTAPYVNWTVSSGTLPAGLTINAATGVISGTPTGTGTANFSVTVTDSAGSPATTAPKALSIAVNAALTITNTDPLPGATAGTAYANVLAATGGTAPYTWSVSAGTLPAGLTLFNAAGVISGVPTTASPNAFTVQVTDSNGVTTTKALSILVGAAVAPTITTTALPNAIIGSSYTYQLQRTGGIAPFTWAVSPALPAGLSLDTTTGLITGTPTGPVAAAAAFNFTVTSSGGAGTSPSKALSIAVTGAGAPVITTTTLPDATINSAYPSQQLLRTGGTGPTFTWALAPGSGPLPTGLALSAAGAITGTPTVLGPVTFTVRVTDSATPTAQFDDQVLSINVVATGAVTITTTSIPNATINAAYAQTLARTGGTAPFTWSVVVAPPAWLTLNASTGQLTGTPTATAAAASFTVRVTDANAASDDQVLSITVGATAPTNTGNGSYYGPCKAFYKSASADANSHASAFKRLLDAAGVTAQVQSFCDVNGQPESTEDQEFRRLCTSFFSGSNGWRSGGSKVSGLRRLIEAAGSADALRSFCTTRFGGFTGQECDDDDLHGTIRISFNNRGNDNGNKKGKH